MLQISNTFWPLFRKKPITIQKKTSAELCHVKANEAVLLFTHIKMKTIREG